MILTDLLFVSFKIDHNLTCSKSIQSLRFKNFGTGRNPLNLTLKGMFAKNKGGYRLNAIKKRL